MYDAWNLVAELDHTNALVRSLLWGTDLSGSFQGAGGVGGLLGITITTNGGDFPAFDGNGNVSALVSASSGTQTATYEYGPFGEVIRAEGLEAPSNPIRFSTKYQDTETDHLYYGYRCYDPVTGKWLSRDPLTERGGANVYGFALNNPSTLVDRLGMDVFTFWRKDDPVTSWGAQSDAEKRKWFSKFKSRYGNSINNHANTHCVPKRLLAAIIAAEMIDYSGLERLGETAFEAGETLGPAQIRIQTAIKENLFPDVKPESFSNFYGPGAALTADEAYYIEIRTRLNNIDQNIQAAARLMNKYLKDMCQSSQSGSMSASFLTRVANDCKIADFCCQTDCKKAVEIKVPKCLISGMAAQWDFGTRNGVNLWNVPNIITDPSAYDSASHGANAELLTDYVNNWW